jgi:hypothetical protein
MAAGEWSFLLWLMAAVVALLSSHLFVAWIRRSQGYLRSRDVAGPALLSATSLAVGLSSAMVLALGAEPLAFPLGYRWPALPVLLFGALLGCLPAAWWLTRRQNLLALIGAGLLISVASLAVQTGWILAAGFRPGPRWNMPLASGAAIVAVVGYTASMWLAYSDRSSHGVAAGGVDADGAHDGGLAGGAHHRGRPGRAGRLDLPARDVVHLAGAGRRRGGADADVVAGAGRGAAQPR